jgi:hypothetical protein
LLSLLNPRDHDRNFTFTVSGETYNGSIHFLTHYPEKSDFVEVLRNVFFRDETHGDIRAESHRNTTTGPVWVSFYSFFFENRDSHRRGLTVAASPSTPQYWRAYSWRSASMGSVRAASHAG